MPNTKIEILEDPSATRTDSLFMLNQFLTSARIEKQPEPLVVIESVIEPVSINTIITKLKKMNKY